MRQAQSIVSLNITQMILLHTCRVRLHFLNSNYEFGDLNKISQSLWRNKLLPTFFKKQTPSIVSLNVMQTISQPTFRVILQFAYSNRERYNLNKMSACFLMKPAQSIVSLNAVQIISKHTFRMILQYTHFYREPQDLHKSKRLSIDSSKRYETILQHTFRVILQFINTNINLMI